jgi:Chaperone of endosialidase
MSTIINATTTNGVVIEPDNSGSLVLQTNSGTTALTIDTSQRAAFVAGTAALPAITTTGDTNTGMFFPAADTIAFAEGGAESMRIDSSGNLLVGVTSGSFHKLVKNNPTSPAAEVNNASTTAGSRCLELQLNAVNDSTGTYIRCGDPFAYRFQVLGNGNAQNTNNSYGSISDIKLKENIVDATPKLEKLMNVKVRNYNLIGDELKQIGVIAQELETVFPKLIDESIDKDTDGNDLGTTTKSVKYSVFVPMLIKAIQEQQTIINDLKARVETLEAK